MSSQVKPRFFRLFIATLIRVQTVVTIKGLFRISFNAQLILEEIHGRIEVLTFRKATGLSTIHKKACLESRQKRKRCM